MSGHIPGLHHVTAICSDAQQNINFYCGVLGLRLVKLTVNFDDPGAYHLYYGDELGRPGSCMTFFAWPGAQKGRDGNGQTKATAFSAPAGSLEFWKNHLQKNGVATEQLASRFGDEVLSFQDPDGLQIEIIATQHETREPWNASPISSEYSIRGFHSVSLCEEGYERTAHLLTDTLRFRFVGNEGNRFRYETGDNSSTGAPGAILDVLCCPDAMRGRVAVGSVHHVAWRAPDDSAQAWWHAEIARLGFNVSPILDRTYFRSIYFREPGGVLFEIATDDPGFTADEAPENLGTTLKLPSWLEAQRPIIQRILPSVELPSGDGLPLQL